MTRLPQLRDAREERLAVAREQFFTQGLLPQDHVSPIILRSWERCRCDGLDHTSGRALDPVGRARLSESRERSACLLEQASGVMEHVFEQIRASGSMMLLADTEGTIIHSLGDPGFVDRAERVSLQPGACWSEQLRGTNGIGTAILERGPVEVLGSEHYLDRNGFLACSGSPIFDAHGELAGVFDISGDCRTPQRHTLGLVRLSVQLLEKRLFETEFARDILIAVHARPEYIGSLQEGLIAVDSEGRILGTNPAAREVLASVAGQGGKADFADLFKLSLGGILDRSGSVPSSLLKLDLRKGGALYVQVRSVRPLVMANARTEDKPEERAKTEDAPVRVPAVEDFESRLTLDSLATGDEHQQRAVSRAKRIGGKDIPLLIQGESGVGKELFARAFHNSSARGQGPFVALNCAAIPENLIESELFGYAGGAFTGARREGAVGKVQQADGGTLFLDEIGDMPLAMQTRLLRVLQERSVTPVGSMKLIPVDISLVCATHRVLREAVASGEFREDLYYRVNGLTITLPPLRERSDIAHIAMRILESEAPHLHSGNITISGEVMRFFERYPWPGNIRQLQSVIRVGVALLEEGETEILATHLPEEIFGTEPFEERRGRRRTDAKPAPANRAEAAAPAAPRSLDEIELEAISSMMREVGGNVSAAARRLGVSRNTLYRKLGRMH